MAGPRHYSRSVLDTASLTMHCVLLVRSWLVICFNHEPLSSQRPHYSGLLMQVPTRIDFSFVIDFYRETVAEKYTPAQKNVVRHPLATVCSSI